MLQDRLNKVKDYFQSIEQFDGKWVICVKYKPKWGAYPSDNGKINAVPDETTPDVWWYYGKDEKVDIDAIFDLIDETIQTNLDAVRKVELFKLKANELKRLFSDESISFKTLQTLEFVFNEDRNKAANKPKKSGKTKPRTKKDILKIDESVIDEPIATEEMVKLPDDTVVESLNVSDDDVVEIKKGKIVNATELSQEEIDDLRG